MMPQLTTNVQVPKLPFCINFDSRIMSVGSCFADAIGSRLRDGGFDILSNPFGTLYNPASISLALTRIMDDREIVADDLVHQDGLWHSWYHHGSFSCHSMNECLQACNNALHEANLALKRTNLLMITFGTAWVYERESLVVANCHKVPACQFVRRRMSVEEIFDLWKVTIVKIQEYNPNINLLFTVSPIRHMADGAHGNQVSKSTLMLALESLFTVHSSQPALHYFPSYEIMMDELRDYRFYAADMTHPSPLAMDIIWQRFCDAVMISAVQSEAHMNSKQNKRKQHIPLH